ncbi:hypothetical protein [Primorskyibacter sedentarius]|uniref:ElaB/YqjD/DUF883 family membrane-anchored ribosome-binding protein n=1 Tax=Primorskyibacter sedentarius TaxID=745311 RepID=A0A4V2UPH7_9RHOB|nr:hypothetical protein [Primorskyibacter sedentarius]TCS65871.1 hypothetical protein EDD52_103289 [Primorskyibacter sedentarius]
MATQGNTVHKDFENAKAEVKAAAEEIKEDARSTVDHVRGEAERIAQQQANAARQRVADEVGSLGGALRKAARDLQDGTIQEQAMSRVADGIADLSDNIATADLRQGVDELAGYARRQPVAFLGAAALLGFAGARFLKASDNTAPNADTLSEDWPEYS